MTPYTLFKVCYFGTQYHGSQRQPGLFTIEGEILKALFSKGYLSAEQNEKREIQSAGRTDAGVHARGMVYGIQNQRNMFYPIEINTVLPDDIVIWSFRICEFNEVTPRIHPRYQATQRQYRYFLPDVNQSLNPQLVHKAIDKLIGTHDFRNFSKFDDTSVTKRTIDNILASKKGDFWIFEFKARSFLWNQIRKMMDVILKISTKKWPIDIIDDLFNSKNSKYASKIEPVSPDGLILWGITYPEGLVFKQCEKSIQKLKKYLFTWIEQMKMKLTMTEEINTSFQ